jgi:eukaryotic-like serine/threonine-protein kinase
MGSAVSDKNRKLAESRVGQVVKKWTIDRLLDVGGMAAVFLATHRNGNQVAIKMLHPQFSGEGEAKERFLREGYAANKVGHPGALRVLDDDVTSDGAAFIVMELLRGQSMESRLAEKGVLDPLEAFWIADQALDVLAAAHAAGIVHRDIKPANLYLTDTGEVKVLDFGFARVREATQKNGITREGIVIGTVSFMAPEQASAKHDLIDGRADLFSVGATLFAALTGRVIHEGETPIDRLMSAMRKPAPSLAAHAPELPPEVVAVVDKSLRFARDERYPDARSMQADVRRVFTELSGGPTPSLARPSWADASPVSRGGGDASLTRAVAAPSIEVEFSQIEGDVEELGASSILELSDEQER